jgi:site-specific recombinase XerD
LVLIKWADQDRFPHKTGRGFGVSAVVAQLVEHHIGNMEVSGPNPDNGSRIARIQISSMEIELLVRKFCEHSKYIKGLSPETIKRCKRIVGFYSRFAHLKNIGDVTESNLRELFINGRIQRNWKSRTFIVYYHSLSAFFRWCIANRYMAKNPIAGIELPKMEKRLPTRLSKQDAMRLLEVVYNYPYDYKFLRFRNHAIFAMFMLAGLRRNELLNLRLSDVDTDNLTIFVSQGKGNRDRIIPMSYTLAETLKRYTEERRHLNKTCPQFFASLNRNLGFTSTGLKRLVEKMRASTQLDFTVHKLRHTFATLMIEGGCDIYSLSRMMGHSDIKTTTIYLSASAEHLRSQVSKHPLNDLVRMR